MKRPERTPVVSPRIAWLALGGALLCAFALILNLDLSPPRFKGENLVPRSTTDVKGAKSSESLKPGVIERTKGNALRIAFAPIISPESSFEGYRLFADYLGRTVGMSTQLLQPASYSETNDLLRFGRCDLAFVCTYAFVRGEEEFGLVPLVVPVVDGEKVYQSYVIVPASSRAKSLLDLKGKAFASADVMSTSGWLFPALWLRNRGIEARAFFSELLFVGSHDRAIRAVEKGYVAGAAVDSLVYNQLLEDEPGLKRAFRIMLESPFYGTPPVVVSPRLSRALRERLKAILTGMHQNPQGEEILRGVGIDRFVVPEPGFFDSVRLAVQDWESSD